MNFHELVRIEYVSLQPLKGFDTGNLLLEI